MIRFDWYRANLYRSLGDAGKRDSSNIIMSRLTSKLVNLPILARFCNTPFRYVVPLLISTYSDRIAWFFRLSEMSNSLFISYPGNMEQDIELSSHKKLVKH